MIYFLRAPARLLARLLARFPVRYPARLVARLLPLFAVAVLAGCQTSPDSHGDGYGLTPAPRGKLDTLKSPPPVATTDAGTTDANWHPSSDLNGDGAADLFQRLRAGYQLAEEENTPIDQQIAYFVNKPEFLSRTFERAERYLYYVTAELEARHMPAELAMLPVIESAYNPYAYSRARAAGIWQFVAPTAMRYQVRVNWWQDGRRDIVDSTRAALDYLAVLHNRFGDWELAVAAYNCGEGAVQRAIDRNRELGLPTTFWHLKLPNETRGYVPSLLAMARILEHPDWYGLAFTPIPNRPYFARVEVPGQIDLRVAAEIVGVTEAELHALNPAFNRWATDPGGPHMLLVPFDSAELFRTAIAKLAPEVRMPLERHTVIPGETVASLARSHDMPVATISMLNPGVGANLAPGSEIMLPASNIAPLRAGLIIEGEHALVPVHAVAKPPARVYVVRHGDTLWSIAKRNHVDVKTLAAMNGMKPRGSLPAGAHIKVAASADEVAKAKGHGKKSSKAEEAARRVHYTVRNGDSLSRISEHFDVSVAQLKAWNSLPNSRVHPGQKLVVYLDHRDLGG